MTITAGEIAKLDLKPGDTLVVHCDSHLSQQDRAVITTALETQFPGHKCIVVPKGLRLGVLTENPQAKFREFF